MANQRPVLIQREGGYISHKNTLNSKYIFLNMYLQDMADTREIVISRGRAYLCAYCNLVGEKKMVISHIYKTHLALEASNVYCSLCLFRSARKQQLDRHVRNYAPHTGKMAALREIGNAIDEGSYLKTSSCPTDLLEGCHYHIMDKTESDKICQSRTKPDMPEPLLTTRVVMPSLDDFDLSVLDSSTPTPKVDTALATSPDPAPIAEPAPEDTTPAWITRLVEGIESQQKVIDGRDNLLVQMSRDLHQTRQQVEKLNLQVATLLSRKRKRDC